MQIASSFSDILLLISKPNRVLAIDLKTKSSQQTSKEMCEMPLIQCFTSTLNQKKNN